MLHRLIVQLKAKNAQNTTSMHFLLSSCLKMEERLVSRDFVKRGSLKNQAFMIMIEWALYELNWHGPHYHLSAKTMFTFYIPILIWQPLKEFMKSSQYGFTAYFWICWFRLTVMMAHVHLMILKTTWHWRSLSIVCWAVQLQRTAKQQKRSRQMIPIPTW